jgi:glycosyltransferase involved in cell wall biosynthesis
VHNGVDPAMYDPPAVPPEQTAVLRAMLGTGDRPPILFVGRLSQVKGTEPLLLAMPSIVRAVPEACLVVTASANSRRR